MSPAQALAADLGYAEQTLDNWLRQDREILKHAAAFLAWVGDRL